VAWAHPEIVGRPEADRPDLVLVSVDTWRADRMSLYGHDRPTTPRLDAWAAERAAVFTRAVAPAPWTLPSHTSMLTGLDALGHGVNHPSAAASYDLVTVAERLRAAGYFTAAVTGGGWLHPGYGLAQGFDRYRYWPARGRGREEWAAQAAALAGELRSFRRPYFLFVHTYAVHDYRALPPDREDGDPEALRLRRYDRALTETDALLGPLLERLSGGETAVVVTSDHGEGLLAGEEPGHGSLYEHTLRVPLLISVPDRRGAGTTVASLARTVDVVPTLLELSGLAVPPGMDGRSLLPRLGGERPDRPPVAVSYMALDSGLALRFVDWKYTFDNSALARTHGREALYRLDTDPGETIDLAPGNPRAERYRSLARRWLRERLAGLGLRLVNTSAESFRGRLVGTQVDPQSVKAAELPCHCLEEDGEGAVSFEVPRGGSLDLLLEAVSEPKLRIEADRGGGQRLALAVDLDELRLPVRFRFTGDGWREAAPGELDRGVELRWHRMRGMGETAPYERDEALRRQLEALGYLGTKRDSAVKALGSE
jgi:arylsulfatase A-like enzyme